MTKVLFKITLCVCDREREKEFREKRGREREGAESKREEGANGPFYSNPAILAVAM